MTEHPELAAKEKSTHDRFYRVTWATRGLRLGLGAACRLAPGWMGRFAFERFMKTRRRPRPDRETVWLARATAFRVPAPAALWPETATGDLPARLEAQLPAWSWGSGPTVLLVHGWEGRGSQMGDMALALAAAGYRAVAYDAPGHGDAPGGSSSLPEMAAALEAVAARVGPLHGLVAHSAGAAVTGFALGRGLAAQRVAVIAPGIDPSSYVRRFALHLGLSAKVVRRMERHIETRFGVRVTDFRAEAWGAGSSQPLLIVADEDDREVPLADARRLAEIHPDAHLTVTSGLGHRRILSDPAVLREVTGFLATAEQRAAS